MLMNNLRIGYHPCTEVTARSTHLCGWSAHPGSPSVCSCSRLIKTSSFLANVSFFPIAGMRHVLFCYYNAAMPCH